MRQVRNTSALSVSRASRSDEWPAGYTVGGTGRLRLRGVAVDELANLWGTPLWVVDEAEFVHRTHELIRLARADTGL